MLVVCLWGDGSMLQFVLRELQDLSDTGIYRTLSLKGISAATTQVRATIYVSSIAVEVTADILQLHRNDDRSPEFSQDFLFFYREWTDTPNSPFYLGMVYQRRLQYRPIAVDRPSLGSTISSQRCDGKL